MKRFQGFRMNVSSILFLVTVLALFGCSDSRLGPPREGGKVAISEIVGSLKCALAEVLVAETRLPRERQRLTGRNLTGKFIFEVVASEKAEIGGQGSARGPFVFSYLGGAGSVLPSASASVSRTDTITTEIPFSFANLQADNTIACLRKGSSNYGFSTWFSTVIAGLDANVDVQPKGRADAISYSGKFAVIKTGKTGLDFDIVFVSVNASAESTRNDVQTIEFKIESPGDMMVVP